MQQRPKTDSSFNEGSGPAAGASDGTRLSGARAAPHLPKESLPSASHASTQLKVCPPVHDADAGTVAGFATAPAS